MTIISYSAAANDSCLYYFFFIECGLILSWNIGNKWLKVRKFRSKGKFPNFPITLYVCDHSFPQCGSASCLSGAQGWPPRWMSQLCWGLRLEHALKAFLLLGFHIHTQRRFIFTSQSRTCLWGSIGLLLHLDVSWSYSKTCFSLTCTNRLSTSGSTKEPMMIMARSWMHV